MFSIYFTKAQAEQFIKESLQKNFINVPEFIVRINDEDSSVKTTTGFSDKPVVEFTVDSSVINPWLTPDENGWFTHDPNWKAVDCPPYITGDRKVFVILHDYNNPNDIGEFVDFADSWNWSADGNSHDIIKWKYAE